MLQDSSTFIKSATIERDYASEGRKGNAFPVDPSNSQVFQLTEDITDYTAGFYVYSSRRSDWVRQEDFDDLPYDIGLTVFDRPRSLDVVCKHFAVRTFQIPSNFQRSRARASVEATANYRFTVKLISKDEATETEVGYIDFTAFQKDGVFTAIGNDPIIVLDGEMLVVQAQEERDATLKSVDITIFGNQISLSTGLL